MTEVGGLVGVMASEIVVGEDDQGNVIVILITESGREIYAKVKKENFRIIVEELLR